MFDKLTDIFRGKTSLKLGALDSTENEQLQIATGVLLLEMAGADEDYAPEEVQAIFGVMQKQFGIAEEATMDLLEAADAVREEKGKIDDFVKTINDSFDNSRRQIILSMIWQVIIADGKVDKFEQRFANQMKARLKLSDDEAEAAKRMALKNR